MYGLKVIYQKWIFKRFVIEIKQLIVSLNKEIKTFAFANKKKRVIHFII